MAEDAAGLLDALHIKAAHVMGASLGGGIAQELAIRHPEKVLSLVSIMSTTSAPELPKADKVVTDKLLNSKPATTPEEAAAHSVALFKLLAPETPSDSEDLAAIGRKSFERCYDPDGRTRQAVAVFTA